VDLARILILNKENISNSTQFLKIAKNKFKQKKIFNKEKMSRQRIKISNLSNIQIVLNNFNKTSWMIYKIKTLMLILIRKANQIYQKKKK